MHFSWADPVFINGFGHAVGLLFFGLIVALLLRDSRVQGVQQTLLSLLAAFLAFTWNAGSLIALGARNHESTWVNLVITVSFASLSALPAVLFQVMLQGRHRKLLVSGYIFSATAICLHFAELISSEQLARQAALVIVAAGFSLLPIAAYLSEGSRQVTDQPKKWEGLIQLICLLLFSISFLHFGYEHVSVPWTSEITWHHLGIPAALVILLQDYRSLLLDTFFRWLVNFGLAAAYVSLLILAGTALTRLAAYPLRSFDMAVALVGLCLSLILFAYLRNVLQIWVSRAVLARKSVEASIDRIVQDSAGAKSEEELLAKAGKEIARYLSTEHLAILTQPLLSGDRAQKPTVIGPNKIAVGSDPLTFRPEIEIPLRFSGGDSSFLVVGPRRGGRRYLSEDLPALQRLAAAVISQMERFRAEELKRLVSQAELRALQAQINPHFLFNSLNALYGTIDRNSFEARRTVLNLAELFRYLLRSDRTIVQLSEELRIVRAYLEIESLRLGDRLETQIVISDGTDSATIPVLTIQPLVENAVKHGVAGKSSRGTVCLRAEYEAGTVRISVSDTGLGFAASQNGHGRGSGVGLENVRRRLMLCYGPAADLQIVSNASGTTVSFSVPIGVPVTGTAQTIPG